MGIAYSGSKIVSGTFPAGSRSELIDGLHGRLTEAEWPFTALADGYKYTLISPQGLKSKLTVRDTGRSFSGVALVDLTFMSFDEARVAPLTGLGAASGRSYQIIADCCQMFTAVPGVGSSSNTTVSGGIPYVTAADPTGECALGRGSDVVTSEAWWYTSDYISSIVFVRLDSFRLTWTAGRSHGACRNGALVATGADANPANPRILPACLPTSYPDTPFGKPPVVQFYDNSPLLLDPLIMWGNAYGAQPHILGQLYDSFWASKDYPFDHVMNVDGLDFVNFTHNDTGAGNAGGSYLGSLFLLSENPAAGGLANYAY